MTEIQEVYRDVLNEGYALHWYEVKSVLGRGSFGVTYLAQDKNLDQLVAIKEYFPRDFSSRAEGSTVHPTTGEKQELYEWGLVRFVREAQTLAKFKHHNIVRVMSVFELNNTAYMIMEYEQGEELSKVYKRKKHLTEQELLDIFLPIMDGLKLVHDAGFIHRDIKPANIFIRADGSPVLIDFGAARKTIGTPTRTVTSLVSYGYAPFEQYNESDDKQGAWTDIYALGACLYLAVVGKLPPDALARGSSLLSNGVDPYEPASVLKQGDFSSGFLSAIDYALMFHPQDRPQDILVWADMLSGKIEAPLLAEEILKSPGGVVDEDATVIMTTPPSVSQRRDVGSHPTTKPAATPSITPATSPSTTSATTTGLETQSPASRWNVKVVGVVIVSLVLVAVGTIFILWKQGGPTETEQVGEKVEQPADTEKQQQLASLLESAGKAYKAGKLLNKDGGAIYLYQQILILDPANSEAANRVKEIIELSLDGIRSDLAEGFDERAQGKFQLLQDAAPDSPLVLALREDVQKATAKQNEISKLLKQADADFKAGRLISPKSQNALSGYRQVQTLVPDNPDAKLGIENILAHYITLAEKNLARGKVADVESNIDDILSVDPNSEAVKELRSELQALKTRSKQQQEIAQLLSRAQRAMKAGNLTSPVNENALALYQRALNLDKKNATAKQGIKAIEKNLQSQFKKYLTAADFSSAESLMMEIENVMPKSKLARDIRTEWERSKPPSRPDIDIITEMIGKFKQGFESRNMNALRDLSEYQANREAFLQQFFNIYTSFKITISDVNFIGRDRKGTANVSLKDLINKQGASVEPGAWSRFQIVIRRNSKGQWKIFW